MGRNQQLFVVTIKHWKVHSDQRSLRAYSANTQRTLTSLATPLPRYAIAIFVIDTCRMIRLRIGARCLLQVSWYWVSLKVTNRLLTSARVALSVGAVVTNLNAVTGTVALVLAKVACTNVFQSK